MGPLLDPPILDFRPSDGLVELASAVVDPSDLLASLGDEVYSSAEAAKCFVLHLVRDNFAVLVN